MGAWHEPDWDRLKWNHRVLLVFGLDESVPTQDWEKAWRQREAQNGLAERRVRVLTPAPRVEAALRRQAGVNADGWAVVLIGLDGGVKAKWTERGQPSAQEVFARIDAMPMRQQEMRRP